MLVNLEFLLLIIAFLILIVGFALLICLIRYSCLLRKRLSTSVVPHQSTKVFNEKPISISTLTQKNENSSFETKEKTENAEQKFVQRGVQLIDRPIGKALRPSKVLGPVLFKMETAEQHWTQLKNGDR